MFSHRDTCFLSASARTWSGHTVALFRHLREGSLVLETKFHGALFAEEGQNCTWDNVEHEAHTNLFAACIKNL